MCANRKRIPLFADRRIRIPATTSIGQSSATYIYTFVVLEVRDDKELRCICGGVWEEACTHPSSPNCTYTIYTQITIILFWMSAQFMRIEIINIFVFLWVNLFDRSLLALMCGQIRFSAKMFCNYGTCVGHISKTTDIPSWPHTCLVAVWYSIGIKVIFRLLVLNCIDELDIQMILHISHLSLWFIPIRNSLFYI